MANVDETRFDTLPADRELFGGRETKGLVVKLLRAFGGCLGTKRR